MSDVLTAVITKRTPTLFAEIQTKSGSADAQWGSIAGNIQNQTDLIELVNENRDKSYEYTQLSPASSWRITHSLNKYPSVTVVDSAGSVVVGDVAYVDKATVIVTFKGTFSGKAYLN